MTQKKFLFQEEFGVEASDAARKGAHSELAVEKARAEAFEAGREAALSSIENALAESASALEREIVALRSEMRERQHVLNRASIDLAMLIARKVTEVALDRNAVQRVEAVLLSALNDLPSAERITLRVAPNLVTSLEGVVSKVAASADLRLVVTGDGALRSGDIALDWRDAAIKLESKEALDRLFELINGAYAASVETGDQE